MKKTINALILVLVVVLFDHIVLGCNASYAAESGRKNSDFIISVSVAPGYWITDLETDMKNISSIANVIRVGSGRYKSFQDTKLKPTLDAAQRNGLKVILCYYRIKDGNTSLEETVVSFGNHPAVIGFKIQDELGSHGEPADQMLNFLKDAKMAIRKNSDKPIMFDVVPWEFWLAGHKTYEKKYPGASNSALDSYINAGVIDWILISVDERYTSIPAVLPKAVARWGSKVKILIRTSASFKGDTFVLSGGSDPVKVRQRAVDAYNNGAHGIDLYAWQHANNRVLNKDGTSNPLYEGMQRMFREFKSNPVTVGE